MKTFGNILKLLAVLATIAGAIYVVIKFGDKIVAWFKKVLHLDTEDEFEDDWDDEMIEAFEAEEKDFEG